MARIIYGLNVKKHCAEYRIGLWECPQFLFIVMGVIISAAILATDTIVRRFAEPEIAALVVLALSMVLLAISYLIVRAFERVARASKSKSEFISIMSHQLRSPLSVVKWQLDLLRSKNEPLNSGDIKKFSDVLVENNERMIFAVNDLLEVNRIEDRDIILRPKAFSLAELSESVIEKYKIFADAQNISVNLTADNSNKALVFADEDRIRTVIGNLLDNAIRYSKPNGTIVVNIQRQGHSAFLEIIDNGAGISSEDKNKIFEKFFRAADMRYHHAGGTGIGLFVARALIKLSGGTIGFSSETGKGSKFWFHLPLAVKK